MPRIIRDPPASPVSPPPPPRTTRYSGVLLATPTPCVPLASAKPLSTDRSIQEFRKIRESPIDFRPLAGYNDVVIAADRDGGARSPRRCTQGTQGVQHMASRSTQHGNGTGHSNVGQGVTFTAYDGKHYPRFTQKHAACMDTRLRRSAAYQRMDRAQQRKLQALVRAQALRSPCTAPVAPQALRTEVALTVVQRAQPVHMTSTARKTTPQEPVVMLEYRHECVMPRAWVPVVSHMLDALLQEPAPKPATGYVFPVPAPVTKPAPKAKEPVVSTRTHAVKGRTGQDWAALDYDALYRADEEPAPAPVPTAPELQHYGVGSGEYVVVQGEAVPMPIALPAPIAATGHVAGCACYECLTGEPEAVESMALAVVVKPTAPERIAPAPTSYTSVDEAWDMGYTAAWAGQGRGTCPLGDEDGEDWHAGWAVGAREHLMWYRVDAVPTCTVGKKTAREWAELDMQNAA